MYVEVEEGGGGGRLRQTGRERRDCSCYNAWRQRKDPAQRLGQRGQRQQHEYSSSRPTSPAALAIDPLASPRPSLQSSASQPASRPVASQLGPVCCSCTSFWSTPTRGTGRTRHRAQIG